MRKRLEIDRAAFTADYEAGVKGKDLTEKYGCANPYGFAKSLGLSARHGGARHKKGTRPSRRLSRLLVKANGHGNGIAAVKQELGQFDDKLKDLVDQELNRLSLFDKVRVLLAR